MVYLAAHAHEASDKSSSKEHQHMQHVRQGRQRTQLVMASGSSAAAGDMAEELREHQRCSMGAGAPMPMASMSARSCSMYCRSAPLGFLP